MTPRGPIAAVLAAALAGCGADGTADRGDARPADPALDGGPGRVTVTVVGESGDLATEPDGPAAATVVFVEPDGTETVATVDPSGHASAVVTPGTTVFVLRLRPTGFSDHLAAFTGIDPGMDLTAGARSAPPWPPALGDVQVVATAVPGASVYGVALSCEVIDGSSAPIFFLPVRSCAATARATLVITARDDARRLLGYGIVHDLDLRAVIGGTVEVPITIAPALATATFTSVPPEVVAIAVTEVLRDRDVAVITSASPDLPGGAVVTVVQPVAAIGDRTVVAATFSSSAGSSVRNLRRFDGQRLSTRIDLGATMLPFMTTPTVNLGTRTAAWTWFGGSGRRPDLVVIRGYYPAGEREVEFTLVGPGDRTHLSLPAFPLALAAVLPRFDAPVFLSEFYGIDGVGRSYRDLLPTADPEARGLFFREDAFADLDELWITGRW